MRTVNRFRPGVNSLGGLNRVVDAVSDAGGRAESAMDAARRALRKGNAGFFAQLTGTPEGGDPGEYTFQELYLDAAAAWQLLSGGRGTVTGDTACEVNGFAGLAVGVRVWIQEWPDDTQRTRYHFQAASFGPFVLVEMDDGGPGDRTTPCTYTYTVKDLAGNTLNTKRDGTGDPATGMTPTKQRPPRGMMTAPAADSIGLAFYDPAGDLVLVSAFETETPED